MRLLGAISVSLSTVLLSNSCLSDVEAITADSFQCSGTTLNPLEIKGRRFFDSVTGDYFPVIGIAYFPRPNGGPLNQSNSVDYFTDEYKDLWTQDIGYIKQLGVNTVRLYAVDPSKNHDAFMCALQEAGLYAMVGLLADCENCGIGSNEPPSCYPNSLKERGQYIINEFSKYSNTLGFDAGNEVTLHSANFQIEINAPCQKKFIRDMRSYINTCSNVTGTILPRQVPIGMANWDYERELQSSYFICEATDPLEAPDWYGMNVYLHCDPNAVTQDDLYGWIALRDNFTQFNLPVPVIITEFGCRERFATIDQFEAQRNWLQVGALYSPSYEDVFAGGVVFEYSAEKFIADQSEQGNPWPYNGFMKLNYGVGYYSPVDCDHATIPCVYNPYPEFYLLADAIDQIDVSSIPNMDNSPATVGQIPTCPDSIPSISNFIWDVDSAPDLPCYVIPTNAPTASPTPVADNPTGGQSGGGGGGGSSGGGGGDSGGGGGDSDGGGGGGDSDGGGGDSGGVRLVATYLSCFAVLLGMTFLSMLA